MQDLSTYRHNVTSQSGEDGILQQLFAIIGVENHWCVEFGAGDGKQNSNTWNLINNHAWAAVLIEADRSEYTRLRERYTGNARVSAIRAIVKRDGPSGLAALLGKSPIPKDFDLLVVDIDGDDYHVWESFEDYRPRVVVVEFNHTIPFDVSFVQAYQAPVRGGASLAALRMLGEKKGYVLVYAHGSNALFVDRSIAVAHDLGPASNEALRLATPAPAPYFQLYDGSVVLWGGGEGIARRASKKKYVISPVWLGGGSVISPVLFSREWRFVRSIKEYLKETALYPHGRALYDRWLRRAIRRMRRLQIS
jgi:hypothetical protein